MALFDAHKNFAYSTVATAPSPATSGTSLVVAAGEGALFPAVPFNATICPVGSAPTSTNAEIVRVTARSTDTLTITRTQEGSSARTVIVGDAIFAAVTARVAQDIEAQIPNLPWTSGRYYGSVIGSNAAHTALRMYAYPLWVPNDVTVDRIGINVTTGIASSAARCLIYADNGAGAPGTLLFDPGADLTTTGTGVQEHTVSWALTRGLVWLAMETNSSGTFATNQTHVISLYSQLVGHGSLSSSGQGVVTTGAISFGAGPTPFPTHAVSAVCPVIRVRAA